MKAIQNGKTEWKTERCINHKNIKATVWDGHLHRTRKGNGPSILAAGFCSASCITKKSRVNKNCFGCRGTFSRFEGYPDLDLMDDTWEV